MAAPVADMGAASAIADFSDNEEIASQDGASDDEEVTYTKPRGSLAARMAAATSKSIHDDSASDDEEPTEYVSKAAGFAARMRALESRPILDSSSEDEERPLTGKDQRMKGLSARERMKLVLQREKEPRQPEEPQLPKSILAPVTSTNGAQIIDDDAEDIPVARKPRNLPARTSSLVEATPEPESAGEPAEESLFFSSPMKPTQDVTAEVSDDDALPDLTKLRATSTFKALLAKKKGERLAKEAAEEEARRLRHQQTRELLAEASSDSEADRVMGSIPDLKKWHDRHGRTKRTSRKAMEEETKETQRLARSMQLAHEITTKKKISKQSLFARFNYKADGVEEEEPPSSSPRKVGDIASTQEEETPATSPLTREAQESRGATAKPVGESQHNSAAEEDEMPTLAESLASSAPRRFAEAEKGEGIAQPSPIMQPPPARVAKQIRVLNPKITARASMSADDDSDDDLEIVKRKPIKTKKDMDEIFKNVPAKKEAESGGMHALRLLANLTSPSKNQTNSRLAKNARSINQAELTMTLQQKARQQAAREREEKMNELRAKGVHIPTKEEKEAEQNEVIDLVARAREENARIRKKERKAQKLANIEAGIVDLLDDSEDSEGEDEDWDEDVSRKREVEAPESDEEADDEIELSGSEDEEMDGNSDAGEDDIIDDAACESENDEDEEMGDAESADFINDNDEDDDVAPTLPSAAFRRKSRKSQIVDSDDEADQADDITPTISVQNTPRPAAHKTPGSNRFLVKSPAVPTSVLRSATKNFIPGIPVNGAVGLGLTQIFAGTMDSQADFDGSPMPSPSQESPSQSAFDSQQDSLAFLKNLPPPDFGGSAPLATADDMVIPSSQAEIDTILATQDDGTQAVKLGLDSQSQAPELTQDQGLSFMSPIKGRYSSTPVPTMDTVVIAGTPQLPEATPSFIADSVVDSVTESPVKVKKGKLRQRFKAPVTFTDSEDEGEPENDFEVTPNAFVAMRLAASQAKAERRARREREEFDRKKSKAKELVDEAATESEDEYAGLGGVSGSDSDSDDEALNKVMLDETKLSRKGKAEIAALAAKMDLEEDEARVNKLYKDITTGGIRRKRGADYDLTDSDDDGEARRRMKRREFAKMRKALMEDENVGKIVANPKSAAFLKSLEDREDDMDFDDFGDESVVDIDHATNSQLPADGESQEQGGSGENSQSEGHVVPPKQPSRLPPAMRRRRAIQEDKRASSLAEIRANVSQLLEDPNAVHMANSSSSDSELDIQDEDDALSVHEGLLSNDEDMEMEPQDTSLILGETSVIKTTTRKEKGKGKENLDPFASRRSSVAVVDRSLSRQNSAASSDGSRMVFGSTSSLTSGFKVPPLLRKATGNSISSAASSFSGEAGSAKLAAAGFGAKTGNTAKAKGYKGFAKEEQRQKVIQEGEQKRIKKKLKGAEERRKTVGGVFGGGRFE